MATENLILDESTIIEEVTGTRLDDVLLGNTADNIFNPIQGNNIIDGRGGFDFVNFDGTKDGCRIEIATGSRHFEISDRGGVRGSVDLANVDRLKFSDKTPAIDLDGNAGNAARTLAAVLGKAALKNTSYADIDASNLAYYSGLIDSKTMTAAQLTTVAADLDLTAQLIDLAGLSKSGWEYIPFGT